MRKQLILFDLDETLKDQSGAITEKQNLKSQILTLQNNGWLVGLNSDTPFKRLLPLYRELGMRGPIISELGSCVHVLQKVNFKHYPVNAKQEEATRMSEVVNKIPLLLLEESRETDMLIHAGNTGMLLDDLRKSLCQMDREIDDLVLLDTAREYSMCFYCFRIHHKMRSNNTELLNKLLKKFRAYLPLLDNPELFQVDANHSYGICIIHHANAAKSRAVPTLNKMFTRKEAGEKVLPRIIMIGNEMSDFLGDYENIEHFAVSNASDELQEKTDFLAITSFSRGCVECLDKLLREGQQSLF